MVSYPLYQYFSRKPCSMQKGAGYTKDGVKEIKAERMRKKGFEDE